VEINKLKENQPQFLIHGKERKKLKKELSLEKSFVSDFWRYQDCELFYRRIKVDPETHEPLIKAKKRIIELEILLNAPYEQPHQVSCNG